MSLSNKQQGVVMGMALGAALTILLIVGGITLNPFDYCEKLSPTDRLGIAMKSGALLAISLAVAIGRLARHRFFTPEDIDGGAPGRGSERARLLQALLQNTLEQSVLAILVYMAWAATMHVSWLSVVPLAAIAFLVGRVLFFAGYEKGAPSRALGFTLSFYPSVGMLLCIGFVLVRNQIG